MPCGRAVAVGFCDVTFLTRVKKVTKKTRGGYAPQPRAALRRTQAASVLRFAPQGAAWGCSSAKFRVGVLKKHTNTLGGVVAVRLGGVFCRQTTSRITFGVGAPIQRTMLFATADELVSSAFRVRKVLGGVGDFFKSPPYRSPVPLVPLTPRRPRCCRGLLWRLRRVFVRRSGTFRRRRRPRRPYRGGYGSCRGGRARSGRIYRRRR